MVNVCDVFLWHESMLCLVNIFEQKENCLIVFGVKCCTWLLKRIDNFIISNKNKNIIKMSKKIMSNGTKNNPEFSLSSQLLKHQS